MAGGRGLDPMQRPAAIMLLLLDAGPMNADQIIDALRADGGYPADQESARRQFERDKRVLEDREIPLRTQKRADGWWYDVREEDLYVPELGFTPAERMAVDLALQSVRITGTSRLDLLTKLDGDPSLEPGLFAALDVDAPLPELFAARRVGAPVTFTYAVGKRTVELWSFVFHHGHWYVRGLDRLRGEPRNFRVDRIDGSVELGQAGTVQRPPDETDARAVIPDAWQFTGEEPMEAVVRIRGPLAPLLAETFSEGATVEADDEGVLVRVSVTNRDGFR
ncbi:MAG: WYL domain-containing protein, partial [Actinobacteria bacterium]|nr:WYL domain-containing protein [Actinomycetota bacterium]